jgi:hypothetical protein
MDFVTESLLIVRHLLNEYVADDLKTYINSQIDSGEFTDGYEIAVCPDVLMGEQVNTLIDLFCERSPLGMQRLNEIANVIQPHTYYGLETSFQFVDIDNALYSDGIRIYRIENGIEKWKSNRISWDGVRELRYDNGIISGLWYQFDSSLGSWHPFSIDYHTGKVINGPSIPGMQ